LFRSPLRAKHQNNTDFAQNGWFVGFTPRRNPNIIVCVLFEGGEHGKLAARLATQVIKAYVDKQQRQTTKVAQGRARKSQVKRKSAACGRPQRRDATKEDAGGDHLQSGRFLVDVARKRTPLAVAAPGMH